MAHVPIATFASTSRLTSAQVYFSLKNFVYPPCKLEPDEIRMYQKLEADLGYVDNSKRLLASKTNSVFSLVSPNSFTGPEIVAITDVRGHHTETCKKLKASGRMDS